MGIYHRRHDRLHHLQYAEDRRHWLPASDLQASLEIPWQGPGLRLMRYFIGEHDGQHAAGGFVVPGTQAGDRASQLPVQDKNQWNQWTAGSTAQVAMGLSANPEEGTSTGCAQRIQTSLKSVSKLTLFSTPTTPPRSSGSRRRVA